MSTARRQDVEVRRLGLALMAAGAVGLAVAVWGLWWDVGWIAQPFYAYAWWSYILLLDGFTAVKRGSSLLTRRRSQLARICVWSITFWFFFELLNLRYQNWYYVGVFEVRSAVDLLVSWTYTVACFATVLTGIFETYEALTALSRRGRPQGRRARFPRWVSYAVQGIGVLMIALSLIAPEYLSPLVWGSVTLLLDPWNYRRGARSLLWDLEHGNGRLVARVLAAGLVCGLVWESLNFFAPQKWIYTVRGLELLKLFEMPLLGFLGFPALALDAFAAYSFVSYHLHGNTTWENADDLCQRLEPRSAISPTTFAVSLPAHLSCWVLVTFLMQSVNVGSYELDLQDFEALRSTDVKLLRREGIQRPRQLLRAAADADRKQRLRSVLGCSSGEFERLLDEARLYAFKGIGRHHGALLRSAGIESVRDLGAADPESLYRKIEHLRSGSRIPALRREMVRVWVFEARGRAGPD